MLQYPHMKPAKFFLTIVFFLTLGLVIGRFIPATPPAVDRSMTDMNHAGMDHGMLDVSGEEDIPSVKVSITGDAMNGFDLYLETENFVFSPENANGDHVSGEGHAHLYINNEKVTRIYGQWHHIHPHHMMNESNEVCVRLSTNDHRHYALGGNMIESCKMIEGEISPGQMMIDEV